MGAGLVVALYGRGNGQPVAASSPVRLEGAGATFPAILYRKWIGLYPPRIQAYTDIFLHKIVKWNDPKLQAINPTLKLPNRSIAVAARQDGSGTTFALSNHLSAISSEWSKGPGTGYVVDWSGRAMRPWQ
jgi:ABC-type phosphate transport system substrate-binding protein